MLAPVDVDVAHDMVVLKQFDHFLRSLNDLHGKNLDVNVGHSRRSALVNPVVRFVEFDAVRSLGGSGRVELRLSPRGHGRLVLAEGCELINAGQSRSKHRKDRGSRPSFAPLLQPAVPTANPRRARNQVAAIFSAGGYTPAETNAGGEPDMRAGPYVGANAIGAFAIAPSAAAVANSRLAGTTSARFSSAVQRGSHHESELHRRRERADLPPERPTSRRS